MNSEETIPNSAATSPKRNNPTIWIDVLIVITVAIGVYTFASQTDALEAFIQFTSQHENLELDEIGLTLMISSFVLAAILGLRWRQLHRMYAERQKSYEQLDHERHMLRTLLNNLPDYIFFKDAEGKYVITNHADALAVPLSLPADMAGKRASDIFPENVGQQYELDDDYVMSTGEPLLNAIRDILDREGKTRTILVSKVPLRDRNQNVIGLVGISRDVTLLQEEMRQALEEAREGERVKMMSSFMQDAAHDFRTPLATISTSLYLLERTNDAEKRREHSVVIEEQLRRMERLLEGLTTMTRLDSQPTLQMKPVDLNRLLQSAARIKDTNHKTRQVELNLQLDPAIELIYAAEDELYEAMKNLIDNALQYTPDGGAIDIHSLKSGNSVVIEVKDSGMGISEDELLLIFDRFYRIDRARDMNTGGIGLGLSITRKVIELHHGTIDVQSTRGVGTTIRVTLPTAPGHDPKT